MRVGSSFGLTPQQRLGDWLVYVTYRHPHEDIAIASEQLPIVEGYSPLRSGMYLNVVTGTQDEIKQRVLHVAHSSGDFDCRGDTIYGGEPPVKLKGDETNPVLEVTDMKAFTSALTEVLTKK